MPQADTDTLVRDVTPILYVAGQDRPWVRPTRLRAAYGVVRYGAKAVCRLSDTWCCSRRQSRRRKTTILFKTGLKIGPQPTTQTFATSVAALSADGGRG